MYSVNIKEAHLSLGVSIGGFDVEWLFVSHPIYWWNLIPNMLVFGHDTFWKCLGYEDGALMNVISAFIKEIWETSPIPSAF